MRAVPRLNQNHEHRGLIAFCYNDSFFSIARRCSEHPGASGFVGFRGSDGILTLPMSGLLSLKHRLILWGDYEAKRAHASGSIAGPSGYRLLRLFSS